MLNRLWDFFKEHKYIILAAVALLGSLTLSLIEQRYAADGPEDPTAAGQAAGAVAGQAVDAAAGQAAGAATGQAATSLGLGPASGSTASPLAVPQGLLTHNLFTDGEGRYLAFSGDTFAEYEEGKMPERGYVVVSGEYTAGLAEGYESWELKVEVDGRDARITLSRKLDQAGRVGEWQVSCSEFALAGSYTAIPQMY